MDRFLMPKAASKQNEPVPETSQQSSTSSDLGSNIQSGGQKRKCDSDNTSCSSGKSKVKIRKYDSDYLRLGFICALHSGDQEQPQCVICLKMLSNASMTPAKLSAHLQLHPAENDKPIDYFKRLGDSLTKGKKVLAKSASTPVNALRASFLVAFRVAKMKKAHTIAENLILPAAVDMVTEMIGENAAKKLKEIPLSNNTIHRRIIDMSEDIEKQLVFRLSECNYSIQLDESTDISSSAVLMCYVRYPFDNNIEEEFLFSVGLDTRTTAEEIYKVVNKFMQTHHIPWSNCVGVCSDGAAAMTGKNSGVVKKIQDVAPRAKWYHCFIHRENLASKSLPAELHETLKATVKVVNFIKANPLNCRLFEVLCDELGAQFKHLLLHTEVRWLSRGKVLLRLYELRKEVHLFLSQHSSAFAQTFENEQFVTNLAYLADIFGHLNELNLSLQGKGGNVFSHNDKIVSFKKKLDIWEKRVKKGRLEMFSLLDAGIIELHDVSIQLNIQKNISEHLQALIQKFNEYFPVNLSQVGNGPWISDPFLVDIEPLNLQTQLESDLIQLSCDSNLKREFSAKSLSEFWMYCASEYPLLSKMSLQELLPFSTTYLCELGVSTLTALKDKYRNRLDSQFDLRVCLSSIVPNISNLSSGKQAHPSH